MVGTETGTVFEYQYQLGTKSKRFSITGFTVTIFQVQLLVPERKTVSSWYWNW